MVFAYFVDRKGESEFKKLTDEPLIKELMAIEVHLVYVLPLVVLPCTLHLSLKHTYLTAACLGSITSDLY